MQISNRNLFRLLHLSLGAIHGLLTATILLVLITNSPIETYYYLNITQTESLPIKLILFPLVTHTFALIFHLASAWGAYFIVDEYLTFKNSNPLLYPFRFFVDTSSLVTIMLIHGVGNGDIIGLTLVVYTTALLLCYYYDTYHAVEHSTDPHYFATSLYAVVIVTILLKCGVRPNSPKELKLTLFTISAVLVGPFLLVLQRWFVKRMINHRLKTEEMIESEKNSSREIKHDVSLDNDDHADGADDQESGETYVNDTDFKIEYRATKLDSLLLQIRLSIRYEMIVLTTTTILLNFPITWLVVDITRHHTTLQF